MKYKITLSYDGTEFCGWQSQPNGSSIQDAVETAANKLFCTDGIKVTGSGRTDAGVHALAQVAHFDAPKSLPIKNIVGGLNAYLPSSVHVISACEAAYGFDARKSAKQKTYMYVVYGGVQLPVLNNRVWFMQDVPDISVLNAHAQKLVGEHDFATFMAAGGSAKTSVRTVYDAHFERLGNVTIFYITANGFLYNMVRIITAQIFKAARGEADIAELIQKRDRTYAKELAPACGLYLYKVDYGDE